MDISFIIPIYNTPEKKLRRCLDSIIKIKNIEYEVILVDDGSKTYVSEICSDYTRNNKFKYYYKSNAGVSAARNYGIDKAQGEYIAFVDSDDEIIAESYEKDVIKLGSDLIIYKMCYKNEEKEVEITSNKEKISAKYIFEWLLRDGSLGGPVAKLFKRSILNNKNIYFDETMNVAEDADFLCRVLYEIKDSYYVDKVVYLYDYVAESGNNRVINFPEVALESYKRIYYQKLNALKNLKFEKEEREKYKNIIGNDTINIMSECAGILKIHKKLSNELKEKIILLFKEVDKTTTCRMGKKNKIYYWVLKRKLWGILTVISKLRGLYQKYVLKI